MLHVDSKFDKETALPTIKYGEDRITPTIMCGKRKEMMQIKKKKAIKLCRQMSQCITERNLILQWSSELQETKSVSLGMVLTVYVP